ncbi:2-nitropropane dioxygenase [Candidatus Hydrogenosomobacter endosymbioticus]|uniref:2-nitropropane dioxygenase n=1 Tax=Candidatus Hydrogenosomobacter endosymbioticus TaxID=2558174 RepID=A0ABM7V9X6_9PROT|nr:2-nitropropane dioxygenase [Candidatus Hydrogenosomobacter endosymbioticus]
MSSVGVVSTVGLPKIRMFEKDVIPIVEGGKGIAVSDGRSCGAWAAAGCVGTFSGVNADSYDSMGAYAPMVFYKKLRADRQQELLAQSIIGGIRQAEIAHEVSSGRGAISMNVMWEMGGVELVLEGILQKASKLIDNVVCGAGMPYRLAEIASKFGTFYSPIVSSARAFSALWKRTYHKFSEWLGSVVYEDPWLAGGHNGLSNAEDPLIPEAPYSRIARLRAVMNEFGLEHVPIVIAGGVWSLAEWRDLIRNDEVGSVAFQFGTRAMLTVESPIPDKWKNALMNIEKGDVSLNKFSPTGFYSSAVRNRFLRELEERSERQVPCSYEKERDDDFAVRVWRSGRTVYVKSRYDDIVREWLEAGFSAPLQTPSATLIFVSEGKAAQILSHQVECVGCLSRCLFSGWDQSGECRFSNSSDPRSFCIQKTLQSVAHGGDVENELMFSGHNGYRFSRDPFYANGFVPTVQQLVDRLIDELDASESADVAESHLKTREA